MKKKIKILLFMMLSFLVLAGWGKKEVKLLDSSKLIDLNAAIELAKPGGMSGDSDVESETNSGNDGDDGESYSDHDSIQPQVVNIVIRVRGNVVTYTCGNHSWEDVDYIQLKSRIRADYSTNAIVILYDDYAEAHTYRDILVILDEMKNEIGLIYMEDQDAGGDL